MLRPPTSGTRKGNGAGKGDGWGGPSKGAGKVAEKAPPFEPGNKAAAGYHDMSNSQRVEAIDEMLFGLALGADRQETRVTAGLGLRDRLVPKTIHNINTNVDPSTMTDAELAAYLNADPEPKATH